jgi:uncharacterized protein YjbJ (UPF0337 family)
MVNKNIEMAKGRVKQAAGALSADKHLKNEGRVEEANGSVKNAGDNVAETVTGDNRNNKRT